MNRVSAKPTPIIPTVVLVFVALLLLTPAGNAQRTQNPSAAPGGNVRKGPELPSVRERQLIMDEMERQAAQPRTPEQERLALSQIAEDFKQIQIINNKMMADTMGKALPNYGSIAETTTEIKRRAKRLKDNLRLAEADDKDRTKESSSKKTVEAGKMKANLLVLDETIMSFINNSIFRNPQVVNLAQSTKARQDLDEIIQLSELIKKDAERLVKASAKP